MKPTDRYLVYATAILGLAVVCVGLLIFAGFKSAHYSAPQRPALSQAALQQQLATAAAARQAQASAAAPKPAPKHATPPTKAPATTPGPATSNLVNTGPGNLLPAVATAVLAGYLLYRRRLLKHV